LDADKAYELLGVKPGVSNRELKAAHRDLAKVWHPDRFLHDPPLREKAQERLKEINEAYELLKSGKTPRPAPAAQTAYTAKSRTRSQRSGNWKWVAVPLLVFLAVFAVTTRSLLQRRSAVILPEPEVRQEPASVEQESSTRPTRKVSSREEPATQVAATSSDAPPSAPTTAVETVTVTIDPESGLLAKPDCRLRSRMTYPRGSEPSRYCNLNHAPPKESRIKSISKTVRSLN
jgi:DnaJ domain